MQVEWGIQGFSPMSITVKGDGILWQNPAMTRILYYIDDSELSLKLLCGDYFGLMNIQSTILLYYLICWSMPKFKLTLLPQRGFLDESLPYLFFWGNIYRFPRDSLSSGYRPDHGMLSRRETRPIGDGNVNSLCDESFRRGR